MRLLVARCEVLYTGRLTARLPEAVRLLMFKADGSFLVHDDAGRFRPLNSIRRPDAPSVDWASVLSLDPFRRTNRPFSPYWLAA